MAIVWFKHDLRVDDHPGLAAAAEYEQVLPLFIFDPQICTGYQRHPELFYSRKGKGSHEIEKVEKGFWNG